MNKVILVDENDTPVGVAEKLEAHQRGVLHRAFSVFVFNSKGQILLQKRASTKYHSGGLWSNTCCSHPEPGENTEAAAHRRLMEEMGFDCTLTKAGTLLYKVAFPNGLTEHEFDHLFIGHYDGTPTLNSEEAEAWEWVGPDALKAAIAANPERYTYWFKISLPSALAKL